MTGDDSTPPDRGTEPSDDGRGDDDGHAAPYRDSPGAALARDDEVVPELDEPGRVPVTGVPIATYRLQLGPDVGFTAAADLVPQLARLGISHLYVSPVAEAVLGSSHGYDVTRPDRIRSELGGEADFMALCGVLADHGMGLVVDIVPNHLSVADPAANPLWWDVLRNGRASTAAPAFDIDWDDQDDKVVLPVLESVPAEAIDSGVITTSGSGDERRLRIASMALPLAPGTEHLELPDLLDAQHYRLVRWRRQLRNVRRFFTIDDLVALRVEHEPAARLVNELPRRWHRQGLIEGVRVDHVDGLAEPGRYLERLRDDLDDGWILVEKILAPGERVPASWPIAGTTGYDAMRLIDHALVDPEGEADLRRLWHRVSEDHRGFEDVARAARHEVLDGDLAPDLARCVRAARRALPTLPAGDDTAAALAALTVEIDRYRTYLPADRSGTHVVDDMAARAAERTPRLAPLIESLRAAIVGLVADDGDVAVDADPTVAFVRRWQQLCAPVVAKGDEDRAFYRFHRLSALCEVGGTPDRFGIDIADFHADLAERARSLPSSLVAGTTHDTKRSEDVRARLLVLSEVPQRWSTLVAQLDTELSALGDRTHRSDRYLAIQTAVGAWPISSERLGAFSVKAAREADERTSWTDPDEEYEAALTLLAGRLVEEARCSTPIAAFVAAIAAPGRANSLAGLVLRATMPGVPDVYQGCETWNGGLVDPDNRRMPDFASLGAQVDESADADAAAAWADATTGTIKTLVLRRLLELRRRSPSAFGSGAGYRPLLASGPARDRIISFVRDERIVVVVSRWHTRPPADLEDVHVGLDGAWHDVIADRPHRLRGSVPLASLLGPLPVAVLERR